MPRAGLGTANEGSTIQLEAGGTGLGIEGCNGVWINRHTFAPGTMAILPSTPGTSHLNTLATLLAFGQIPAKGLDSTSYPGTMGTPDEVPPFPTPLRPSGLTMNAVLPLPTTAVDLAPQEVRFPDARGGRRPKSPLVLEVLRPLGESDLQALGGAVAAPAQRLLQIRHSHHQLARLLCEGRDQAEVALITGYTPSYISSIQNDPAFAELLNYYAIQREQVFIDTVEALKVLGLTAKAELQRRLEEAPEKFSSREIMEAMELLLIKPTIAQAQARGASSGAGPGVAIQVSFVGTGPRTIDITPRPQE